MIYPETDMPHLNCHTKLLSLKPLSSKNHQFCGSYGLPIAYSQLGQRIESGLRIDRVGIHLL